MAKQVLLQLQGVFRAWPLLPVSFCAALGFNAPSAAIRSCLFGVERLGSNFERSCMTSDLQRTACRKRNARIYTECEPSRHL
eukprot:6198252-Pleurochrysis_carterae.AAC.2